MQDALGLVGDVEETLDKAAGQAEQVSDAADQMQSIKPGAADTAADLTDSLQSELPSGCPALQQLLKFLAAAARNNTPTCYSVPTILILFCFRSCISTGCTAPLATVCHPHSCFQCLLCCHCGLRCLYLLQLVFTEIHIAITVWLCM